MKYLRLLPISVATTLVFLGAGNAQAQSSTITVSGVKYTFCGSENDNCTFSGKGSVVFGSVPPNSPTTMLTSPRTFTNGVGCYVGAVSQTDPAYGYGKSCWVSLATTTKPVTTSPVTTPPATTTPVTTTPVSTTPVTTAPVTTTPVTTTPVTTSPTTTSPATTTSTPAASAISCGSPAQTAGGTANGLISADTLTTDGMRIYPNNTAFSVAVTTNAPNADTVIWSIADANGAIKTQGSFAVKSGAQTATMSCKSTWSGYGSITATLQSNGGTLPNLGTRPMGIATFGVLPNLASVLGTVTYAHQDQHRFGMQGFNDNINALHDLGISWTIDDREVSAMEPNGPNTYTPSVSDLDPFYKQNPDQMRIVRLDGLPAWDSKTGQFNDMAYAPSNMTEFQNYMGRVGTDTSLIRAAVYPNQQSNYYQVTWEPGWMDSNANFIAMYKAAYQGLHSTDPNAVVMGPTNPFPANCPTACTGGYLQTYGALGLWNYVDAISTHGYWNAGTYPAHPPELQDSDPSPANQANALDNQVTQLRAIMQAGKPNMKLFATEAGTSYDPGINYGPTSPSQNQLFAQAAVGVRSHIIMLGGGAQVTTLFYGSDYPGEVGYGTFFDLNDAQGAYGASNLSPKPEALAFATMTRALDGTNTLGRVTGTPAGTFAYAFQQLGNGKVVTALWAHSNAQWPASGGLYSQTYSTTYSLQVDAAGASGNVTEIDGYGNISTLPYTNGHVTLTLTEVPQYIVSSNATVAKANSTVPVGYTGQ